MGKRIKGSSAEIEGGKKPLSDMLPSELYSTGISRQMALGYAHDSLNNRVDYEIARQRGKLKEHNKEISDQIKEAEKDIKEFEKELERRDKEYEQFLDWKKKNL